MESDDNKIATVLTALRSLIDTKDKTSMSKIETISKLNKDIVAARSAGRTWCKIIKTINDAGLIVTSAYVRACVKSTQTKQYAKQGTKQSKQTDTKSAKAATSAGRNVIRPDTEDL